MFISLIRHASQHLELEHMKNVLIRSRKSGLHTQRIQLSFLIFDDLIDWLKNNGHWSTYKIFRAGALLQKLLNFHRRPWGFV